MRDRVLPKIGLAAAVLLAPGGFVLGAALAAKWWRERLRVTPDDAAGA